MTGPWNLFLCILFDGYELGLKEAFNETRLNFDAMEDAGSVARHWELWIMGFDI